MNTSMQVSIKQTNELLEIASKKIDEKFGAGYAKRHPSVVLRLLQAYSTVYVGVNTRPFPPCDRDY